MFQCSKSLFFSSIATLSLLCNGLVAGEDVYNPEQTPVEDRIKVRKKEANPNKQEYVKRKRARENGEDVPDIEKSANLLHRASQKICSNANQWMLSPLTDAQPQCMLASYLPLDAHWLTKVASNWHSFEIEDGSRWEIPYSDQHILYSWNRDDILVITPNSSWFSAYDYYITNSTKNTYVKANLLDGPIAFGPYSHWVVDIDYLGGHIYLENQMVWCIDPKDAYFLEDWSINDHIIIGSNDSYFSKYNSILINVDMDDYLRAKQY